MKLAVCCEIPTKSVNVPYRKNVKAMSVKTGGYVD